MKGRVGVNRGGGGGPPSDLLVCFPTRAHLTLMPKPICSPSRPTDHSKRHHSRPLFRTSKSSRNQSGSEIGSEPTSPKVTCAGQIKVRPKNRTGGGTSRSNNRISKNWLESVGIKKTDVMHFLGVLRGMRFNMQCFGSFPGPVDTSSLDEEEEEEEEEVISSTVFSKWFMVLEESQGSTSHGDDNEFEKEEEEEEQMPPKNALLLMRCRSAPAKRGEDAVKKLEEEEEEGHIGNDDEDERLMLMSYAPDFFKVSTDIAKETWVNVDPLARSRSWRR